MVPCGVFASSGQRTIFGFLPEWIEGGLTEQLQYSKEDLSLIFCDTQQHTLPSCVKCNPPWFGAMFGTALASGFP